MLSHVSVGTRDLARATRFYDAALGALGYVRTMTEDFGCAWGVKWPEFWATHAMEGEAAAGNGAHVAFIAPSREAVDAFHAAGLAAGGSDAGAPGLRDYTPDYYAAFLRDPDGNKVEAAFRGVGEARLHLMGAPFQIKVWEALLAVPSGHVTTYSDIANAIGRPKAVRAVGTAVGRNPVSFLIPCHRALQKAGGLGGYHWGLGVKRAMLAWESARLDSAA